MVLIVAALESVAPPTSVVLTVGMKLIKQVPFTYLMIAFLIIDYKLLGVTNYCGGDMQTPIAISRERATEDNSVEFPALLSTGDDEGCEDFNFFADDHAWEVSVHDGACTEIYATYNGEEYFFHQLHFHYPSEHTFNGYHDAEV